MDSAGQTAAANQVGILVMSANSTIGGESLSDRNVISGNTTAGILATEAASGLGILVKNNLIGTNLSGNSAIANAVGIEESNLTSGQATISANVISGNTGDGIALLSGANSVKNLFVGNQIGISADGLSALANGGHGINDLNGSFDTIGGTSAADRNVISGNGGYGIALGDSTSATVHDITILGNYIGTNGQGAAALGNSMGGISAAGDHLVIGGSLAGSANVISGNLGDGLVLLGHDSLDPVTYGLSVESNNIGVDRTGLFALGNAGAGIRFAGFPMGAPSVGSRIGGTDTSQANEIGANRDGGIVVSGATGLVIQGNFIGLDRTSQFPLGNIRAGIEFKGGATQNAVGGTVSGAGNVIANTQASTISGVTSGGVLVGAGTSNAILSNIITNNSGIGIDLGADGPTLNGAEGLSNYPLISTVKSLSQTTTEVDGILLAAPNTTYLIQVFSSPSLTGSLAQANKLLGSFSVTTDALGQATISQVLNSAYTSGDAVVSTATPMSSGVFGQTSELSATQFAVATSADLKASFASTPGFLETLNSSFYVEVENLSGSDASNVVILVTISGTVEDLSGQSDIGSTTITKPSRSVLRFVIPTLSASNPAILTISLTSNTVGALPVSVSVTSDTFDPDMSNNTVNVTADVARASDLLATISAAPVSVAPNDSLTYTINVVNRGPSSSTATQMTASFTNFDVSNVLLDGVPQNVSGGLFTLDLGDLESGALRTLVVRGKSSGLKDIVAFASVLSTTGDPNSSNNEMNLTTRVVPRADLAITQSTDLAEAIVGQSLVYTVRLVNQGPSTATNVNLTDFLPLGATYQGATSASGHVSMSGNLVGWSIDQLAPGAEAVLKITVIPTGPGSITNTASAHSDLADPVGLNSLNVKLVTAVELAGAFLFAHDSYRTQDDQPGVVS
ncbi:MAG TPA: hypothetical protein VFT74_12095, partial [Isosphaeraceae bacterium]|nr:hypothetical protein [Isosphaeraceae bacterium]